MAEPGNKISPLLILLIVAGLVAMAWLAVMQQLDPGLLEVNRARFIEPVLQECFINGLVLTAAIEQNTENAYEILNESKETDAFSKKTIRTITRGRKLHAPELSCTVTIKRTQFLRMMQSLNTKFRFSPANRKLWIDYVEAMRQAGIFGPGNEDIQVRFSDCASAKKLYDSLQSFFAVSKSYKYNFNY